MMESIEERRYLEREAIREEYFKMSPQERSNLSLEIYMERELAVREGDKFWRWGGIIAAIVLALLFLFAPR